MILVAAVVLAVPALADTFASGTANEFTTDFVLISGVAVKEVLDQAISDSGRMRPKRL